MKGEYLTLETAEKLHKFGNIGREIEIIEHYGIDHQQRKLVEEVFELNQAIDFFEYTNNTNMFDLKEYKEHIVEELADVTLLLNQIRYFYNITYDETQKVYEYKLNRTLNRMENER